MCADAFRRIYFYGRDEDKMIAQTYVYLAACCGYWLF